MSDKELSAFPNGNKTPENMGLMMRDWFAGKAMQMKFGKAGSHIDLSDMAALCYRMADAMMKARET